MSEAEDGPRRQVEIWTDGGCKPNPGVGAWAAVLVSGKHRHEISGAEPATTNNRMELTAAIKALEVLKRPCKVRITTDSTYVMKGITEWLPGWVRKGWKTSNNSPVKNVDLWQDLIRAKAQHEVEWHWVKGHAGHPQNERADALANLGVDSVL